MRHHHSYLTLVRPLLVGACLAASSHVLAAADNVVFNVLKGWVEEQNARGYGKTVSSELKIVTIANETGKNGNSYTYKIRTLSTDGTWSADISLPPGYGFELGFPMSKTALISLNGGGTNEDIKINDGKGYIEYKTSQTTGTNIWANLVTWNGDNKKWLLNSLFDTISGNKTVMIPSFVGSELRISLVDGYNYGATLSNTFTSAYLKNSATRTFPLRYQTSAGEWIDGGNLAPGGVSIPFPPLSTQAISLNGGADGDDLRIYNSLGYIDFYLSKASAGLVGVTMQNKKFFITQAWFNPNPRVKQWYGAEIWAGINDSSDFPNTTVTPTFDIPNKSIIFELKDKKHLP